MRTDLPLLVWLAVLGLDAALIVLVPIAARRGGQSRAVALALGGVLAAWLLAVDTAAGLGVLRNGLGPLPVVALPVAVSLATGLAATAASARLRAAIARVPQTWLVGLHAMRVVGLVFPFLMLRDILPPAFALPAGWGDFAVGITAPVVAFAFARRRAWARPAAVVWNVLGVADLLVAMAMGARLAAAPLAGSAAATTGAMTLLPLSGIPTFGVPLFLLLHAASLLSLRRASAEATERGRRPARSAPAHVA